MPLSVQKRETIVQRSANCTALFLGDHAQPTWMSVNCTQNLLYNVVCVKATPVQSADLAQSYQSLTKFCKHGEMYFGQSCYKFDWRKATFGSSGRCLNLNKVFAGVFSAVAVLVFPPVWTGPSHWLDARKYFNIFYMHQHNNIATPHRAFCLTQKQRQKLRSHGNTFTCQRGQLISAKFVCDGILNCVQSRFTDESRCTCSANSTEGYLCRDIVINNVSNTCGPLYFKALDNRCKVYGQSEKQDKEERRRTTEDGFQCTHGQEINKELLDDTHVDCSNGKDEPILLSIFSNNTFQECHIEHQLPCQTGHPKCYNLSDICKYTESSMGYLTPCRHGEHLANCTLYECNILFKCPSFYCIPFAYVCNGKWECPQGTDEGTFHLCGKERMCRNMFKCRSSSICIHIADVCDMKHDCPLKDDEYFCDLIGSKCPPGCYCLTYAVFCHNITISEHNSLSVFTALFLQHVVLTSSFLNVSTAVSFVLTQANLVRFCMMLEANKNLEVINVARNLIKDLSPNCFSCCKEIKMVDVNSNMLTSIKSKTFLNLFFLTFLNISNNHLDIIEASSFLNLSHLDVVSMINTSLMTVNHDIFQTLHLKMLETSEAALCCLASTGSTCSFPVPWHHSCTDLLPTTAIKLVFPCIGFFVLVANVLSVIAQRVSHNIHIRKGAEKTAAFSVIVTSVNMTDILCCIPFILLWIFDQIYEKQFMLTQDKWKTGIECYIIFFLFLFFCFLSPLTLCFYSLSRFCVVEFPLVTRFKETRFIFKWISVLFSCCFLFPLILTILIWTENSVAAYSHVPTSICSPFVDLGQKMVIVKVITNLAVLTNIAALVFIVYTHKKLYTSLKKSQENLAESVSKKQSHLTIAVQIVVLTVACHVCWISQDVVHIVVMYLPQYPILMMIWVSIAFSPINSLLNPIVCVATNVKKLMWKYRKKLCFDPLEINFVFLLFCWIEEFQELCMLNLFLPSLGSDTESSHQNTVTWDGEKVWLCVYVLLYVYARVCVLALGVCLCLCGSLLLCPWCFMFVRLCTLVCVPVFVVCVFVFSGLYVSLCIWALLWTLVSGCLQFVEKRARMCVSVCVCVCVCVCVFERGFVSPQEMWRETSASTQTTATSLFASALIPFVCPPSASPLHHNLKEISIFRFVKWCAMVYVTDTKDNNNLVKLESNNAHSQFFISCSLLGQCGHFSDEGAMFCPILPPGGIMQSSTRFQRKWAEGNRCAHSTHNS